MFLVHQRPCWLYRPKQPLDRFPPPPAIGVAIRGFRAPIAFVRGSDYHKVNSQTTTESTLKLPQSQLSILQSQLSVPQSQLSVLLAPCGHARMDVHGVGVHSVVMHGLGLHCVKTLSAVNALTI